LNTSEILNSKKMDNIYFLSFYTEGPEIDGGFNLTEKSLEIKERLSPYFKDILLYNKRTLKDLPGSEDICNYYEEELEMNLNANHIGYFDFKGFLIKKTLSEIPENSILVYHDGNFEKNPQYFESDWENIHSISNRLLNENGSDIFVQIERPEILVKHHVKSYVIDRFFANQRENDLVRNSPLLNAARIIVRNTDFSRNFINEYLELCKDKTLVAKSPDPNPDPDFKWSCGDQDVLNCLIYKYILEGKLNTSFPLYSFVYRVIRFENKPFVWEGQSWNPHPTGASYFRNINIENYLRGL
jgi:hypothetical protein